jgi:hypothetical protein
VFYKFYFKSRIVGGFLNNQGLFWGSSLYNFQQVLCEKVRENCIDLVDRIGDRGAEFVPAQE